MTATQDIEAGPRRALFRGRASGVVIGTGLLVIALMVAVTGAIAVHRYNAELADAGRELRTLDLLLAAETGRSFQSVELMLDNIAEQIEAEDATPAAMAERQSTKAVHDILKARVADVPQLDAVTLISASGRLVNFSRYWPIPDVRLEDRDYFRALRDGRDKLFLSEPVVNRGSGTPTVYLARRLSAPDGTFLGLVLGAVELSSFERLYASLQLEPGNVIALWRQDGVLLARYPALEAGRRMPTEAITAPQLPWHGIEGVFTHQGDVDDAGAGTRVIASRRTDGTVPVQVNIGRTEHLILRDWRREVAGIAAAVAVASLCVLGLMWAVLRRFAAYEAVGEASREREAAIAARAQAEAAREAAEEANRAKSNFLANMSHELRTPLSAVIGYTELLEEEAEEMAALGLLSDLGKVKGNAKHLLGLINDVLDLSKVEANRMDVFPEDFGVASFVEDAAATVDALVRRRANVLTLDLGDGLGAMRSDVVKLRQCLFNLLSNAAKFTENGRITLRVRREQGEETDWLIFAVADTGIGMSAEQMGRLFQRFTQADDSTTRRFGGTGLGLALSRAFARLLGGDIAVESEEGRGTVFTLRVPAVAKRRSADEAAVMADAA